MRLCIAYPNKFRYSETFIHHQVKYLKPTIGIYEGWYPAKDSLGNAILDFPLNYLAVRGTYRNVAPKAYHCSYIRALSKYFEKREIDVVLAEYGPMGITMADVCSELGIPCVTHFHGFDAYFHSTIQKYGERYRTMFQKSAAIIGVSKDMCSQLESLGADPDKLHYNPYGVDTKKFGGANPLGSRKDFIFVGRFTPKKSPSDTIMAFQIVHKVHPDATLTMIGDGELFHKSKKLVQELGLEDVISLPGVMSSEDIATALKRSRCFVQHSVRSEAGDSEGTPNTILEASATGLPIVSTRHAGIKDAVTEDKTGFLVDEGDYKAMGEHMIRLAEDPTLATTLGKAGREFMATNFELSSQIEKLRKIIETTTTK